MYYINLNTKYVNIALKEDKTKGNLYPDLWAKKVFMIWMDSALHTLI
jgi:hypothetical protein